MHWEDACCLPQSQFFLSSSSCIVPLQRPHGGRISRKPPNRMNKPSLDPGTAGLNQWAKKRFFSSHAGCKALQVAELRMAPGGLPTGHEASSSLFIPTRISNILPLLFLLSEAQSLCCMTPLERWPTAKSRRVNRITCPRGRRTNRNTENMPFVYTYSSPWTPTMGSVQ